MSQVNGKSTVEKPQSEPAITRTPPVADQPTVENPPSEPANTRTPPADESTVEKPPSEPAITVLGTPPVAGDSTPTSTRPAWRFRIKLMAALVFPVFLETLDYTVVATAQPHIASTFNRLDLQSYIGTIYVLTSTVFLPIFASFSDIFGRHWALQLSLVLFTFGSALSTGAQNMPMMLAGRGVAGVGAAGLLTVVRVILADSSSLDDTNFQTSMLFFLYTVGFSSGPYIGGALTSISFRWVFAINIPCSLLSMALAFILLRGVAKPPQPRRTPANKSTSAPLRPETIKEKILRVDTIGAVLFIGGSILILLALNWGSNVAWDQARVIASFVVGILVLIGFVVWEWFAERQEESSLNSNEEDMERQYGADSKPTARWQPWTMPETMIPLGVFTNYDVCVTQFAAFTGGMVMLVCFYFLAIFFVIVLNKSSTSAGIQLIYFAPGMGTGTLISILAIKYLRQPKIPIIFGTGLVPIALGLLALSMDKNNQSLADGFLVMCGIGIGLTFSPLVIHARFSQPDERVAVVVALNLFFRTFGGTVGLAQCAAVLNARVRSYIAGLFAEGVLTSADAAQLASLNGIESIQAIAALPPALAQHVRDAFRQGVRWSFISLVPWTGLTLISVLFLSNIRDTDEERREAASSDAQAQPQGSAAPPEPKTKIYGPVTLIIYLIRKRRARRQGIRTAGQEGD